jgi:protein-disulfide isomerase
VREIIEGVLIGASPLRFFMPLRSLVMIVSLAAVGCHAQSGAPPHDAASSAQTVQLGVKLSPDMTRRVELMIRNRAGLSLDYTMSIDAPTPGDVPGYDQILVTLTANGKSTAPLPFLLSTDGKTLAQFNKFDISQNPRDRVSGKGRPPRGGPENAPVLIVGFDDLECPFCARMNATLFPAVLERYKDQVRVVYRDFPLYDIHPWAMHAAVDANCLGDASTTGYWSFVDYVHAHASEMMGTENTAAKANQTLDKLALDEGARQKVDASALAACVQKQDNSREKASFDEAAGDPLHINSAPILFVNGEKIEGVIPVETLFRVIDDALRAEGLTPPPPPLPVAPVSQPAPAAVKPGS